MSDIKESIKKLEKAVLEDGKVDRAEGSSWRPPSPPS